MALAQAEGDRWLIGRHLVIFGLIAWMRGDYAASRTFFQETLDGWGVDRERHDTATLCLSELVTNAVIHSHGGCVVRVVLHSDVLTVWVRDSGIAGAVPLEPSGDPLEVHGRGLQLVEALATSWGHDVDVDGASVWFAIDAP